VVRIPLRLQEELSDLIMAEDQSSRGERIHAAACEPQKGQSDSPGTQEPT
jgi:hypothetical protein